MDDGQANSIHRQPSMRIEFSINQPKMVPRLQSPHTIRPIRVRSFRAHIFRCVCLLSIASECISLASVSFTAQHLKKSIRKPIRHSFVNWPELMKIIWRSRSICSHSFRVACHFLYLSPDCCARFQWILIGFLFWCCCFFSVFCFPLLLLLCIRNFDHFFVSNRCHYGHSMQTIRA